MPTHAVYQEGGLDGEEEGSTEIRYVIIDE
jgi:hypothetical protein